VWSNIVRHAYPHKLFRVLILLAILNLVLASVSTLLIVLAVVVPSLCAFSFPFHLILNTVVPLLFLVQAVFFLKLAITFMNYVFDQRISAAAITQIRQMTLIGLLILAGSAVGACGAIVTFVSTSTAAYCAQIILMDIAGWTIMGLAFFVPGHVDEDVNVVSTIHMWTPTHSVHCLTETGQLDRDSNAYCTHVSLSVMGVEDDVTVHYKA
jgi:hypothetical protein